MGETLEGQGFYHYSRLDLKFTLYRKRIASDSVPYVSDSYQTRTGFRLWMSLLASIPTFLSPNYLALAIKQVSKLQLEKGNLILPKNQHLVNQSGKKELNWAILLRQRRNEPN